MARPTSKHPTELELEILKILWQQAPLAPREVRDLLVDFRDLAYTSVATIMNIMMDKEYLSRQKTGASFVYKPRISEKATTQMMLRDLMDRAFNGSAAAVMVGLIEDSELDAASVRELRAILKSKVEEGRT